MTQPASPELDMASEAVKVAQDRVRLFRLAFGKADTDQVVNPAELERALSVLSSNGRISIQCNVPDPVPRCHAQRLALGALCLETAMAWGGHIEVSPGTVFGSADRMMVDAAVWASLQSTNAPAKLTPALVHFAVLAQTGPADVEATANSLRLTV